METHGKPNNIILITIDSLRWDTLPKMPELWSMAKENAYFTRAYTNGPSTPFSFPSIFSLNYDPMKERIRIREPTLAGYLRGKGYRTAGIVASNPYISSLSGYQNGFDHFNDHISTAGREVKGELWRYLQRLPDCVQNLRDIHRWYFKQDVTSSLSAEVVTEESIDLISTSRRPFFIWIHYMDTHYPYTPPREYSEYSISEIAELNNFRKKREADDSKETRMQVERLKVLYEDSARWLDEKLSDLFGYLEQSGLWENTDMVVTSDHGEGFGEHGFLGHPSQLYQEVVKIPLVVKKEGLFGKHDELVETRDIPSMLSYSGCEIDKTGDKGIIPLRARHAGGRSCMRKGINLISDPESLDYGIWGFATEKYKFIFDEERDEVELYDLETDPGEKKDISMVEDAVVSKFLKMILGSGAFSSGK